MDRVRKDIGNEWLLPAAQVGARPGESLKLSLIYKD